MNNASAGEPLDHATIQAQGLIEHYFRGTLAPEAEERFEAHFMDCTACQEELEAQRSFERGLKSVAAEEAARTALGLGLLAWLSRRGVAVLALLAVLAAGVVLTRLWRENAALETRIAELAAGGGAGDGGLTTPLVGVPVALLSVLRGNAPGTETVNRVTDPGGPWALAVDVGGDPRLSRFAITIVDGDGEARFERRDLLPDALEVIQLTFPSGYLPPGDYQLVATGSLPDGTAVEIGRYLFRLAGDG